MTQKGEIGGEGIAHMNVTVSDNPTELRYELRVDGLLAGVLRYRRQPGGLVFVFPDIEPHLEGNGLGTQLVQGALDDARARGDSRLLPSVHSSPTSSGGTLNTPSSLPRTWRCRGSDLARDAVASDQPAPGRVGGPGSRVDPATSRIRGGCLPWSGAFGALPADRAGRVPVRGRPRR